MPSKDYHQAGRAKAKAYHHANKERLAAKAGARYHDNKEEIAAQHKARYQANKEKLTANLGGRTLPCPDRLVWRPKRPSRVVAARQPRQGGPRPFDLLEAVFFSRQSRHVFPPGLNLARVFAVVFFAGNIWPPSGKHAQYCYTILLRLLS